MIRASPCCLRARYRHSATAADASSTAAMPATSGPGQRPRVGRSPALGAIRSGRGAAAKPSGTAVGASRSVRFGAGGASCVGSAAIGRAEAGRSAPRDSGADVAERGRATASVGRSAGRTRGGVDGCGEVCARGRTGAHRGSAAGGAVAGGVITTGAGGGGGAGSVLGTGSGAGGSPGGGSWASGGRKRSGSRYPSGSAARRTPRCTYGTACSGTPLEPTAPTASPSARAAPRATDTEPRWSSVTE
jgi:hypothetical protein